MTLGLASAPGRRAAKATTSSPAAVRAPHHPACGRWSADVFDVARIDVEAAADDQSSSCPRREVAVASRCRCNRGQPAPDSAVAVASARASPDSTRRPTQIRRPGGRQQLPARPGASQPGNRSPTLRPTRAERLDDNDDGRLGDNLVDHAAADRSNCSGPSATGRPGRHRPTRTGSASSSGWPHHRSSTHSGAWALCRCASSTSRPCRTSASGSTCRARSRACRQVTSRP